MKVLWIGDAACGSGFGRATTHILGNLPPTIGISILGVNYRGDPHTLPWPIYPAWIGGDPLGVGRLKELCEKSLPDLIVAQTNPWNVPIYQRSLENLGYNIPMMAVLAVEGKNCDARRLNTLKHAIFWTEFGRAEAVRGGLTIPSSVIPLGVDLEQFRPGDRVRARQKLGLPEDLEEAFFVTNVNRNQSRKRIDLSVIYFADWIKTYGIKDAYLYLHLLPGSSTAVDVEELAWYYGIQDRLIHAAPKDVFQGAPEEYVVATYQAADVGLTTGLGEGWGLTTMEMMACRIPQIATNYAAIPEWAGDAVKLIRVCSEGVMPDVHNMLGGVPSKSCTVNALDFMYHCPEVRQEYAERGFTKVNEPQFRWENIGQRFAKQIEEVMCSVSCA
jgi:D-inositol-3-phosphate glycosyltransferase